MSVIRSDNDQIVQSSGDIFADLDVKLNPEDIIRIEIAREITRVIQSRKYTQVEVARRLGTNQARVSDITRGRLDRFTADRLLRYLLALGVNLDVHTSDASGSNVRCEPQGTVRFHRTLAAACG
ncbi:helix-turn-helix domain-containing protein [Mesorhizobium koreense]|uniref:helix-turn-helix domain-containing protein n=1 Tax=Mesorhizobium koreense TaxID=3074855 RepID=UPI0035304C57